MDSKKIIEIVKDVKSISNKDLTDARDILYKEFNNTKNVIIDLTKHLDIVEGYYLKINEEISERLK